MTLASYLLGIGAALLVIITVVEMLRRGRLRERHTLWWIIAGVLGLVAGVFPSLLDGIADALGVAIPVNLVFFVGIVVLFLVCLQQSSELTRLEERSRTLAENVALLESRIRKLENSHPTRSDSETKGS
ncbi:DUF2304 domain-containing protein [Leucobacter sp. Z1108]|uniref:DUF2304 domain-containing protein n=1 Tax=Leucobacter sp. Z1108 TaxID=3439066 RepID=UPI003F3733CA